MKGGTELIAQYYEERYKSRIQNDQVGNAAQLSISRQKGATFWREMESRYRMIGPIQRTLQYNIAACVVLDEIYGM